MSSDTNLHAFIASVKELYQSPPGKVENGFDADFQELKKFSTNLKLECESLHGARLENKKKNRYKDIHPFDYSRVKLDIVNDDPNSDYINASFIKGADNKNSYIASQGPLPHTVLDFWRMLWQYNVAVIIMVCREVEMGKKKCERYWAELGEMKSFGEVSVTLECEEDFKNGYCLRKIKAERGTETRYIHQFHYTSWPDHGVPKTCYEILTLINHVRDMQSYSQDAKTPICVHCSAGCGRTGAVLAVDFVRNYLQNKKVPAGLRMRDIIGDMRKQRPAIVQTRDQYEFVNEATSEMFNIYMQTRSLAYDEFSGYQQGAYVNIDLSTATQNGTTAEHRNDRKPPKAAVQSYENIEIVRRHDPDHSSARPKITKSISSTDEYPSDPPPAKPSRTASRDVRPVSVYNVSTTPANPAHLTPLNSGKKEQMRKSSLPIATSQSELSSKLGVVGAGNVKLNNLRTHSPAPGPIKDQTRPKPPPMKPKAKPEPAYKNISESPTAAKMQGDNLPQKPPVVPKTVPEAVHSENRPKKAPVKPRRTMKMKNNSFTPKVNGDSASSGNASASGSGLTHYKKNNVYNDIKIDDEERPNIIAEADYAEFDESEVVIPRSGSNASLNKPSPPTKRGTPPKLPARTIESNIFLSESPPQLPTRTPESYLTIEVDIDQDDQQTYEVVDQSSTVPDARSLHSDTGRSSANNTAGNSLAAKAKGVFEKTSNAFSKVGASIAKSIEDDSSTPKPSTVIGRNPTYIQGPTVYSGQDMSFGKRLLKKVKGGRSNPKK